MKAGIIAIKNREAEHQRMEDEANALKSRDSEKKFLSFIGKHNIKTATDNIAETKTMVGL